MSLVPRPNETRRQLLRGLFASGLGGLWPARLPAQGGAGRRMAGATDEFELTADFDPAAAVWMGLAPGHERITARLAAVLQPHVRLKFLLRDAEHARSLAELLTGAGVDLERVDFFFDPSAGYFLRDLVLFARETAGTGLGVVDIRSTLYGTPVWCGRRHALDRDAADACTRRGLEIAAGRDRVDRSIARILDASVLPTPLAAEGGGIEVNGRGLLIANAPYWVSRNPELTQSQLQQAMLALPGIDKVVWLAGGLAEDVHLRGTITGDHVAWGAGGHTDQFVRFADERTVLLAWPDTDQAAWHPVARLTRRRMERNFELLRASTDARGRRLRVVKVPMPQTIEREVTLAEPTDIALSHEWTAEYFPPHERRRQGQTLKQVATATYLNFVVANEALVLPDYVPHGTHPDVQDRVQRLFESVFPGRRVAWVDAITANWVGGGLHCATANEPANA